MSDYLGDYTIMDNEASGMSPKYIIIDDRIETRNGTQNQV